MRNDVVMDADVDDHWDDGGDDRAASKRFVGERMRRCHCDHHDREVVLDNGIETICRSRRQGQQGRRREFQYINR